MGNRCNNCEWWDAPGKRETGYCLKQNRDNESPKKTFVVRTSLRGFGRTGGILKA